MTAGPQPRYETADANTQLYKYDAWNRLTKIYRDANCNDTIDDPGELVATYSYDGQNRRIRKVVEGDPDVTYDYYYNERWQVVEVRKGGSANPYEQYVWGLQYVDAPVVRFQDSDTNGTLNNTLYYMYDGNFNVTALIGTDGTVAERYVYDPYGKVSFLDGSWGAISASAYDNDILYCGYRFDPESGNYQVRNRYLTPPLGRWLTTDPIGYGDGMNLYQYVGGTPIDFLDPEGKEFVNAGCSGYDSVVRADGKPSKETKFKGGRVDFAWTLPVPPKFDGAIDSSDKCATCWVKEGTGRVTLTASYTGVKEGFQGDVTVTTENVGKEKIWVSHYSIYITAAAAAAVNRHEETHIMAAEGIYQDTIGVAEMYIKRYGAGTPLKQGKTVEECQEALKTLIGWDKQLGTFELRNSQANSSPGGTVDVEHLKAKVIVDLGRREFGYGSTRIVVDSYYDVGQSE
jgi:RHS repeat-associated protein